MNEYADECLMNDENNFIHQFDIFSTSKHCVPIIVFEGKTTVKNLFHKL